MSMASWSCCSLPDFQAPILQFPDELQELVGLVAACNLFVYHELRRPVCIFSLKRENILNYMLESFSQFFPTLRVHSSPSPFPKPAWPFKFSVYLSACHFLTQSLIFAYYHLNNITLLFSYFTTHVFMCTCVSMCMCVCVFCVPREFLGDKNMYTSFINPTMFSRDLGIHQKVKDVGLK